MRYHSSRGPISIPVTPNTLLTTAITSVNASLHAWGYNEEPETQFLPVFKSLFQEACNSGTEDMKQFATKKAA